MSTIFLNVYQPEDLRMGTLEDLGRLLQQRRGSRGIREVAREIGISHATLLRVERGHLPDLENYQKLCKWLGIDVASVVGPAIQTGSPPVAQVHFRKAPTISPKTAQALANMILRAQTMLSLK
jgi:transcriptional regulator with XRE-family HTH domain